MKVLYLGLRPPKGVFHYPVIDVEKMGDPSEALKYWESFTHIIFTSKTAALFWPGPWDKKLIAIGEKTASFLPLKASVAKNATQEGVIELLREIKGFFFYPHSKKARPLLKEYMLQEKIPFFSLELYDTKYQMPLPVPDLDSFEEIVFTSPSTVYGFLKIWKVLPKNKKLTAIGPVTEKVIESYF